MVLYGGKTKSIPTRLPINLVGILFVFPPYNTIMHCDNFSINIVYSFWSSPRIFFFKTTGMQATKTFCLSLLRKRDTFLPLSAKRKKVSILCPSGLDVHSRRDLGGARQNCLWARAQSQYGGRKFLAQNVLNGQLFQYQVLKGRPFYN